MSHAGAETTLADEPVIPEAVLSDTAIARFFSTLHRERLRRAVDVDGFDLSHLSPASVTRAYRRISAAERLWVAPNLMRSDYRAGTATVDNEIGVRLGSTPILFTAEHATIHRRPDESGRVKRKAQDLGTAGLAAVLAEEFDGFFLTMRGRQTSDANFERGHVFQETMGELITEHGIEQVISLHGMGSGKFRGFDDERAYDILLGLGTHPSRATRRMSRIITDEALRLDLRCGANEWFVMVAEDEPLTPQRNPDGTIAFNRFIAPKHTTRAEAERVARNAGTRMSAVQVELSDLLRFIPPGIKKRSVRTRMVGTYLGYEVLRRSIARYWRPKD